MFFGAASNTYKMAYLANEAIEKAIDVKTKKIDKH